MFEKMVKFLRGIVKKEEQENPSKDTAKERLHLVLMQDRANVSADFLELMKQEIIEVIKKYIEIDENAIDVRLTNKSNEDGSNGAPALYANIPIVNVRNDMKKETINQQERSEYLKQEAEANVQEENINEIEEKNEVDKKSTESNEGIENHCEEELDNESIDNNEDNEKAEELSKEVDENSKEEIEVKEEVQQHQNNNRPNYNNQKGYYGKKKNKKHKKNNRNYPKRG